MSSRVMALVSIRDGRQRPQNLVQSACILASSFGCMLIWSQRFLETSDDPLACFFNWPVKRRPVCSADVFFSRVDRGRLDVGHGVGAPKRQAPQGLQAMTCYLTTVGPISKPNHPQIHCMVREDCYCCRATSVQRTVEEVEREAGNCLSSYQEPLGHGLRRRAFPHCMHSGRNPPECSWQNVPLESLDSHKVSVDPLGPHCIRGVVLHHGCSKPCAAVCNAQRRCVGRAAQYRPAEENTAPATGNG
mmetsp:Transcript_90595/g.270297  ORF Transcript_90595/g.270297 Transcript_90595/m.270297 type:complete len:246 (-) Transcript_90595:1364-2101(-)